MAFFFPCEFSFGVFVLGELFLISVLYCIVIPLLRFILCTVVRFDKVWRSWVVFCVVSGFFSRNYWHMLLGPFLAYLDL